MTFELDPNSPKVRFFIIAVGELKPDFQSRMIQMGIMAPYSHIAVMVVHENGLIEIFESIGKGIVKSSLDEVLDNGLAVIREQIEITPFMRVHEQYALGWLNARLGGWYSLIQYLGFVGMVFPAMTWFRKILRKIPLINNGRAFSVCSEFGTDFVLDCSSLTHDTLDDPDFVNPRDLVEALYEAIERQLKAIE